jgi:DNA-binding transcriptional regulator YiaG
MHPEASVTKVLELRRAGLSPAEISRQTGINRGTVRDWISGRTPRRTGWYGRDPSDLGCPACGACTHHFERLPPSYLYLLGLYLGDGCISAHPRGVFRLRIFCDVSYPRIVAECKSAIRELTPNKISEMRRAGGFETSTPDSNMELGVYWKSWPCLFPQHGPGRKHERPIELVDWQQRLLEKHPDRLLRGLIHSDGCRFINTGRGGWTCPRYSFSNRSEGILQIFCDACDQMDLHWTLAPHTVYVSRKADVARMDEFIGPKH